METVNRSPLPDNPIHILLVEDNPGDAEIIQESLRDTGGTALAVTWAAQFQEAVVCTQMQRFDLVVLDLSLPDSQGLDTLLNARAHFPELPVVVLTGHNDDLLGMQAVQAGAQDYLIKGQMMGSPLARAFHFALTRHAMQETIKAAAMTDALTCLNNRRGFLVLAEQQRKLAQRTGRAFLLLYADIDRFKWINDTFGHQEGDRALKDTAELLRRTFRASDVIARLGGDEFVVAALEADVDCAGLLETRLQRSLKSHNAQDDRTYLLLLSAGAVGYSPSATCSIEEMLAEADAAMYAQKRSRERN